MKKIAIILNPAARGERARRLHKRVTDLTPGAVLRATARCGDAECLARNAVNEGYRTVVAAGGDGTINEVVNGIAGSGASLGLLPIGTMNVFATELGPPSYLVSAAHIAARTPPRLRIESKDAVTKEGSFVLIGNGRLYGGPFPFFKQAVIDDGLFDVLVFKRFNYIELLRYMQDVILRPQITSPEVEYFQTTALRVTSDAAVPVEVDGELIGNCPIDFKIRSHGLRVFAPHSANGQMS